MTRAALAAVDEAGNPVRAGLLHAQLGGYLNATGGQGAITEYETAVRLVPEEPPRAERAQVLAALGEALMGQGRHRESRGVVSGGDQDRSRGRRPRAGGGCASRAWRGSGIPR